ncbi:LOW QUALITY PROTEIN: cocaine- and amphetamine-regulated transcript protein-like [Dermochelys coriacea]|uniref:LOW QUALITY PROTEIN: cocaine- and amphetamine-regulated transcript protein-like n=1 Tax=Dermochelys coriacea TaxID=27794 RepID=UPI001CA9EAD0|nr:LOW QUALITY PROTEIN: cocaine- and amphetamine-regulated transcript protein-like [Dermochelys coriacea]
MELPYRGEPRGGSRLNFRTMASSWLCQLCSLLFLLVAGQETLGPKADSPASKSQEEKELIEALQEVLEKLKTERLPSIEKKLGSVPSCNASEPCAMRKGARIGRLCMCPRGTACNFYILKCL